MPKKTESGDFLGFFNIRLVTTLAKVAGLRTINAAGLVEVCQFLGLVHFLHYYFF